MIRPLTLAASVVLLATAHGHAQDFPTALVRIIIPFAPGGVVDIAARLVGEKMSERLGQRFIVENRPGGNGFIAVTAVARAEKDGHTLLMAHSGEFAVNPAVFKDIPYELERDFVPITMVSEAPIVLAAHSGSPYKSVKDVIEAAKASPGTIGYATPGSGTINHLIGEWMASSANIKLLHVPFKSAAPAVTAVAGGEVPLTIVGASSVAPQVKAGRVRMLAVTSAKRVPGQEWPTLQESGVPEVDASIWVGLFAPKGTPEPIVQKLNREVREILELPDVKHRFGAAGAQTVGMSRQEFTDRIKLDLARNKAVVEKAGVRPD